MAASGTRPTSGVNCVRPEARTRWRGSPAHVPKTAATILDEAALSARLVADQLGHSRPSMTQDIYMGRRAVDSQAALALEAALRDMSADRVNGDFSVAKEEGQQP